MWVLLMNDMRFPKIEMKHPVCRAETPQELMDLMDRERCEPYSDGDGQRWHKVFRKGGPLEWFNPPWNIDKEIVDVGTEEDWVENARKEFQKEVLSLPEVGSL